MDSVMVTVAIEYEVWFYTSFGGIRHASEVRCLTPVFEVLQNKILIDTWPLLRETLTQEDYMRESVLKKLEFEVLVEYYEKDGKRIPVNASCQTICPPFVGGWVEQEAMKQVRGQEVPA